MKTLKVRLTELEKRFTELINQLKNKNIIQDAKQPDNKSNPVEPLVKPQVADTEAMNKLQLFLAKNESITKDAKQFNDLLTYKYGDNECKVKFSETTGIPFIEFNQGKIWSIYRWIKLELDDYRQIVKWLKNIGIE